MTFDDAVRHLRQRLSQPLPGFDAQQSMAPAFRQNRTLATIHDKDCREAGVLALLFPMDDAVPGLLLTARRPDLKDHAGQISFPGGRREPDEALHETALREAHEEVNLDPNAVDLLGALTPLYIPPSNFCVYPYVGATTALSNLRPTDAEVDAILRVPLPTLLDGATLRREPWTLHGQTVTVPFFAVEGYQVWGATAMMLAELLALFAETTARNSYAG